MKFNFIASILLPVLIGGFAGIKIGEQPVDPQLRRIHIVARQYAYEPSVIYADVGDTLRFTLSSLDVIHGFYLEGHDIDGEILPNQGSFRIKHPSQKEDWQEVDSIDVVLSHGGKYRYRCSHTCGSMHPFMLGELIVKPNRAFHAGVGGALGLFIGMVLLSVISFNNPGISPAKKDSDEKI